MRKTNDMLWRVKNDERMIENKTIGSGLGIDITMQIVEEDREGRVEDKLGSTSSTRKGLYGKYYLF